MLKKLSWVLFTCGMGFGSAQAAVLQVSGGELTGALGVNVGGTLFDVQFVEGTCVALFSGCDSSSDFTFTTQAGANQAAEALLGQVFVNASQGNFDTQPELTFGCGSAVSCDAAIPFGFQAGTPGVVAIGGAENAVVEAADLVTEGLLPVSFDTGSDPFNEFWVYALFTPSQQPTPAPAPGVLSLLALGFLGLWRSRLRSA